MDIKEGDRFIWDDSVYVEVTGVTGKYATIICRTHPFAEISWMKKQRLPFPDSFIPVDE